MLMVRPGELAFSLVQVERFLAVLAMAAQEGEVRYLWRPSLPDEADNFVYEAAYRRQPGDHRYPQCT